MVSICHYESPLGGVLLAADEIGLTGLWFDGQKYFARGLPADRVERETKKRRNKSMAGQELAAAQKEEEAK